MIVTALSIIIIIIIVRAIKMVLEIHSGDGQGWTRGADTLNCLVSLQISGNI